MTDWKEPDGVPVDHLRVHLKTGHTVLLPADEYDQVRRARQFGGEEVAAGLYHTTDLHGCRMAFEPKAIVKMCVVTEGALVRAKEFQEELYDYAPDLSDDEPWK